MRRMIHLFIALMLLAAWVPVMAQDAVDMPAKTFTPFGTEIWRTPVLSQGGTGTCWSFSAVSFIESELHRLGKADVDLSEMFNVYKTYLDKADYYVRTMGNSTFSQGAHLYDSFRILKLYGAVPQSVYSGLWADEKNHSHGELERVLSAMMQTLIKDARRAPSLKWRAGFTAVLGSYLGVPPEKFTWEGKEYTPRSFADTFVNLNPDDYVVLTSFSHMPFYKASELVVADNWFHYDGYFNLPLDDYMRAFDNAVRNGYSVVMAADVSEKMFKQKVGYAVLEQDKDGVKPVIQAEREKMWDNWETTDDHGMHAVGIARDEKGEIYYLVKNSWGVENQGPHNGHIYMHENYLRGKMESIMMHKDGLPKDLREKLGL